MSELREVDRFVLGLQAEISSLQSRLVQAEAERDALKTARCPRCGEWIRDFPPSTYDRGEVWR